MYYTSGEEEGVWLAALSNGHAFCDPMTIDPPDISRASTLSCDADGDGVVDRVVHSGASWKVAYADGEEPDHDWITGFGESCAPKQNPPPVVAVLTGSLDGKKGWACIVDESGRWFAVCNPGRETTFDMVEEDTYVAWRCSYLPQIPGHEGTYDSGNPDVHDTQILMLHDAGFTYVTMDITNGEQPFVDVRAKAFFESVRRWSKNIKRGQRKLHVNIALGRTRGICDKDDFH